MALFLNIIPLVMVAASMAVSVYLFVSLKKEIHGSETRWENAEAKLALEWEALRNRTQEIERKLSEAASGSSTTIAGMNPAKRSQALRRMKQGEGPGQIAAALNLPLSEVELLLKIHHIVEERSTS